MPLNHLLQSIVSLAEDAGKAILDVYQDEHLAVTLKSDISPLTRADIASHNLLSVGLEALTPKLPILSEESNSVSCPERQQWKSYWLIDPLDGTKEFIKRNGEFTVNIALIENRVPVMGVIHAPAQALTYYAASRAGAFRRRLEEKQPVRITVSDFQGRKLKIVASRSHFGTVLEQFLRRIEDCECVNVGSSLKFCFVAEGTAHLYPRLGPTMEWDTAAGQCIAEEAGARVTTLDGDPLRYNKSDLLNPFFVVSGGPKVDWQSHLNGLHSPNSKR